MTHSTELASGSINRVHTIRVLLQEPEGNPPLVVIEWPEQFTITTPRQLEAVAAKATNVLARATIQLARIKRNRKL